VVLAATGAVEPGERLERAGSQLAAEDIALHGASLARRRS
jgi:hypothetical protein